MTDIVMELAGVSRDVAEDALYKYKDVVSAVDALLSRPADVSGERFIPSKPEIDTGLTPEQRELCMKGRELQTKVNAVFSVAHSQNQTQQAQLVLSNEAAPAAAAESVPVPSPSDE